MTQKLEIVIPDELATEITNQYERSLQELDVYPTDPELGEQVIYLLEKAHPRVFTEAKARVDRKRGE